MTVSTVESRIAEWRGYVARDQVLDADEVDELEAHLRDQIAELQAGGLAADEAFLVAVKRLGRVDAVSREFAREHSGRLWKQLVLGSTVEPGRVAPSVVPALLLALAAAVAVLAARAVAGSPPGPPPPWLVRNASLLVLPFLAAFFAQRRQLDVRGWSASLVAFVVAGVVVNAYPYGLGSSTELLVAAHLPVALWFAVAYPYAGGALRSHAARMDLVRFTGEWAIYYALIALGGGVLLALTAGILEPMVGASGVERVVEWVLPSGAAGAVIIAAWLVESKQRVVENMAPVLTVVFTPLFAVMLTVAVAVYAVRGIGGTFDRDLLGVFDALLVVVLGLVLYGLSARPTGTGPGWLDRVQLVAVLSALLLDVLVLGAMVARIDELGFTPNRLAALGLNVVLLVNLAGAAWLSVRFLTGHAGVHRLERWQTGYLPVFAAWAATVVVVLPPLFAFG